MSFINFCNNVLQFQKIGITFYQYKKRPDWMWKTVPRVATSAKPEKEKRIRTHFAKFIQKICLILLLLTETQWCQKCFKIVSKIVVQKCFKQSFEAQNLALNVADGLWQ